MLLRRIRSCVPDGARLLLIDFWTDPGHTEQRREARLAARDRLGFIERTPLAGPASLIVAETSA